MKKSKSYKVKRPVFRGHFLDIYLDFVFEEDKKSLKSDVNRLTTADFNEEIFRRFGYSLTWAFKRELTRLLLSSVTSFMEQIEYDLRRFAPENGFFTFDKKNVINYKKKIENEFFLWLDDITILTPDHVLHESLSHSLFLVDNLLSQRFEGKERARLKNQFRKNMKTEFYRLNGVLERIFKIKYPNQYMENFELFIKMYVFQYSKVLKSVIGGKGSPLKEVDGEFATDNYFKSYLRNLQRNKTRKNLPPI